VDFSDLENSADELKKAISKQVLEANNNWESVAGAEISKIDKQITLLQAKLIKHEKSKHESEMQAIGKLKESVFPNNSMQERNVNLFSFSPAGNYTESISTLYSVIEPFENDLILIKEE